MEWCFDTSTLNVSKKKDNPENAPQFDDTKIAKRVEGTFSNDHESYSGNSIQDVQIEKDDQLNVPMFEDVQQPETCETTLTYTMERHCFNSFQFLGLESSS